MGKPLRILVIDDEKVVLQFLSDLLTSRGHEVIGANDGEAGIEAFRDQAPDLVVTDIQMPGKSGLDVIREVRRTDPDARIIALTGYEPGSLEQALALGALDTLTKPFAMKDFLGKVDAAVA